MAEAAIAEHGIIGDLQTAALVSMDGSVDWFCLPRFDSPSVFGALLDDARGGHFRIRPTGGPYTSKQVYYPDSAVLVTRFFTEAGVGEVADFMPVVGAGATDRHRLVRIVRCVRGRLTFSVDVAPRFDYGRRPHRTYATGSGAVFTGGGLTLTLHFVHDPGEVPPAEPHVDDGDLHAAIELVAGQASRRGPRVGGQWVAPRGPARGSVGAVRGHGRVLARMARPILLPGTVAGDGGARGDHAEADDVRAHRRARRRPHGRSAGADRR